MEFFSSPLTFATLIQRKCFCDKNKIIFLMTVRLTDDHAKFFLVIDEIHNCKNNFFGEVIIINVDMRDMLQI